MPIEKIVSGGQTGADRAALDVAIELGLPHGGWIPAGRLAEDGRIPGCYNLQETPSADPAQRTEWNIRDSDATLIISNGQLMGGSQLTHELAMQYGKPCLHVDLAEVAVENAVYEITEWLHSTQCKVLNVAGPRSSEDSEIYRRARDMLSKYIVNPSKTHTTPH